MLLDYFIKSGTLIVSGYYSLGVMIFLSVMVEDMVLVEVIVNLDNNWWSIFVLGGVCLRLIGIHIFIIACVAGWEGENCEINIDDCMEISC